MKTRFNAAVSSTRSTAAGAGNTLRRDTAGDWLSPALRKAVLQLMSTCESTAESVVDAISREIPEYHDSMAARHRDDLYGHCLLATQTWYQALLSGHPPSGRVLAQMTQMGGEKCRMGISLGSLLQAFRVGSMLFWDQLIKICQPQPALTEELLATVSPFFLRHFDLISLWVSRGYYDEQSRRRRGRDRLTIQRARTRWPLIEPLTQRELIVLRLLQSGRSNKEIAREMVVCEDTIKFHLRNIYGKLGASRRTEAIARAQSLGLDREWLEDADLSAQP